MDRRPHSTVVNRRRLSLSIALPVMASLFLSPIVSQDLQSTGTATISGTVKDSATGQPIANVVVLAVSGSKRQRIHTKADGSYKFNDVPAGTVALSVLAIPPSPPRRLNVSADTSYGEIDLAYSTPGVITGRVLDSTTREPLPGVRVMLVGREYYLGDLRFSYRGIATTDDRGLYRLTGTEPGVGYFLLAKWLPSTTRPVSTAPQRIADRPRIHAPTFYPRADRIASAQLVTLASGEERSNMDIEMLQSPSYCAEGQLGGVGPFRFEIFEMEPSRGRHSNGGMFTSERLGLTGLDGHIRLCDLAPGRYRLEGWRANGNDSFGTGTFDIVDRDIADVSLAVSSPLPVPGEVVWKDVEGDPPGSQASKQERSSRLKVFLAPLYRAERPHESLGTTAPLPGSFLFAGVAMDDYAVLIGGFGDGLYIHDVQYGGHSVHHMALRVGSALGGGTLRIVVGSDGGFVGGRVVTEEGVAQGSAFVVIVPQGISTVLEFSSRMTVVQADSEGAYRSKALAPGKYIAMASLSPPKRSPEVLNGLLQRLSKGREIAVAPDGFATLQLELMEGQ